jgi:hypothetical protein
MKPMSSQTNAIAPTPPLRFDARRLMLLAAPAAAVSAGLAAEWLDFRELRVPLLLMVGAGVLLTAHAAFAGRRPMHAAALTGALGIATWAAAESVYIVVHYATGGHLNFETFDSQPAQALALIAIHAGFLGAPTGAAAAILLAVRRLISRR